ncbi:50S ribosomal protein L11 [archaeon]|nr:50S ribosomal protein L11 [archaeon]
MPETIVSALVEGGKASAGPPIGPALGPTGVNIGEVVKEINDKTQDFKGIQVPVEIIVDGANKTFKIKVGSPPVSALLKKEFGIETMRGVDIPIDYAIKVAKMKKDNMLANSDRAALKEVLGTCVSMDVTINGKSPRNAQKEVDQGKYDAKLEGKEELVFLSGDDMAKIKDHAKKLEAEKAKQAEEKAEAAKETGTEEEKPEDTKAKDAKSKEKKK